ncbi:MAG TPA: hypothetical protein P5330_09275, partial [Candidatus Competibacteraceae bacterium]|nr:hypothetical protein [Candidatus Competibacteraceae bacterium]
AQDALLDNYLTSPQTLIRQRGGNPDEVLNNWKRWNTLLEQRGLNPKASRQNTPRIRRGGPPDTEQESTS